MTTPMAPLSQNDARDVSIGLICGICALIVIIVICVVVILKFKRKKNKDKESGKHRDSIEISRPLSSGSNQLSTSCPDIHNVKQSILLKMGSTAQLYEQLELDNEMRSHKSEENVSIQNSVGSRKSLRHSFHNINNNADVYADDGCVYVNCDERDKLYVNYDEMNRFSTFGTNNNNNNHVDSKTDTEKRVLTTLEPPTNDDKTNNMSSPYEDYDQVVPGAGYEYNNYNNQVVPGAGCEYDNYNSNFEDQGESLYGNITYEHNNNDNQKRSGSNTSSKPPLPPVPSRFKPKSSSFVPEMFPPVAKSHSLDHLPLRTGKLVNEAEEDEEEDNIYAVPKLKDHNEKRPQLTPDVSYMRNYQTTTRGSGYKIPSTNHNQDDVNPRCHTVGSGSVRRRGDDNDDLVYDEPKARSALSNPSLAPRDQDTNLYVNNDDLNTPHHMSDKIYSKDDVIDGKIKGLFDEKATSLISPSGNTDVIKNNAYYNCSFDNSKRGSNASQHDDDVYDVPLKHNDVTNGQYKNFRPANDESRLIKKIGYDVPSTVPVFDPSQPSLLKLASKTLFKPENSDVTYDVPPPQSVPEFDPAHAYTRRPVTKKLVNSNNNSRNMNVSDIIYDTPDLSKYRNNNNSQRGGVMSDVIHDDVNYDVENGGEEEEAVYVNVGVPPNTTGRR